METVLTRFWSRRPQAVHLGLFFSAYVLGCGFAQSLAIVPGTGISIWPPSGLFIATLVVASRHSWPWWILAGCLAELSGNFLWFHSPLPAALLIYLGNALEAMAGAWLVNRFCGRSVRLETLREVLAFVVLAAGIAPIVSATVGSATLAWFGIQSQTFTAAWPLFWIGDATGVLIIAPLALVVLQNWRGQARLSTARWIEAGALGLIFVGVAALSLSGYLAFAYLIMPPLLWAAVRFEFKGAAVMLALLALMTAVFTVAGLSQFAGDSESQKQKQIMLHLFLAISALSALVVAAISRQHQSALLSLRTRERELSLLVDMVPVHIARMTPDGEMTFFNKRLRDSYSADLDKPGVGRFEEVVRTLVHPDDAARFGETVRRSLATGEGYSMKYRMRRADGEYRWRDGRAEPLRNQDGTIAQWYAISIDIDDEVRLYSDVAEREAKIRRLVDSDIIGIVIWDLDGRLIDANDAFLRMVQYQREDLRAGLRWFDMTPPEWQQVHAREEAEELAKTGMMHAREKEFFRKDGSRVPVLIGAACFEGQSRQGVAYILDLTERKVSEAALRQSERRLLQLVETLPAMIYCAAPNGEPTYRSRQLREYLGFDVQEKEGSEGSRLAGTLDAVIHPDELAAVKERYGHSLRTGEPYVLRHRLRRVDGEYRWVETRAAAMRNAEGTIVQWNGICLDIEDQLRAQEKLRLAQENLARASQAASLAELSASIAHEVNQPLAAVVANSHACQRWLAVGNSERAQKTVERIIRDANSAADVVSRIRALFSQSPTTRNLAALGSSIAEACNLMAEETARRRIRMDIDVESPLAPVLFDRVQVQQVLVNLIRNGMDAMDSTAGDRVLGIRVRQTGDVVQTEISDRGPGISSTDKIFEPFFTTKENGMGMGLAICRSIVESHGGRLWAEKNEPQGARFIFTLPIEAKTVS